MNDNVTHITVADFRTAAIGRIAELDQAIQALRADTCTGSALAVVRAIWTSVLDGMERRLAEGHSEAAILPALAATMKTLPTLYPSNPPALIAWTEIGGVLVGVRTVAAAKAHLREDGAGDE